MIIYISSNKSSSVMSAISSNVSTVLRRDGWKVENAILLVLLPSVVEMGRTVGDPDRFVVRVCGAEGSSFALRLP